MTDSDSKNDSKNPLFKSIALSVAICLATGILVLILLFCVNLDKSEKRLGKTNKSCLESCNCSKKVD